MITFLIYCEGRANRISSEIRYRVWERKGKIQNCLRFLVSETGRLELSHWVGKAYGKNRIWMDNQNFSSGHTEFKMSITLLIGDIEEAAVLVRLEFRILVLPGYTNLLHYGTSMETRMKSPGEEYRWKKEQE